jgi:integrase
VLQPDGTIKRKVICRKLPVPYGDEFRKKTSVRPFAQEILAPLNAGRLNPLATMPIFDFTEKIYLPKYVDAKLRPSTRKSYRDSWRHIRSRLGKLTLRSFRTVHGEQLLADIARQADLGRSSLKSVKAFLSGVFKQAKRLGILDGINPRQDTSIPATREPQETHAYSLQEVKQMLSVLEEPARTVILTAALSGLRKGEIRLRWEDFTGKELRVRQSVWNGFATEPKTARSKAAIPVVKQLAEALEAYRARMGKLAVGPIFQGDSGNPLNLDNLARRVIAPALERCAICKKSPHDEDAGHRFVRDNAQPHWHGWHAFRRGLATNLHQLGVPDKDIQAILRHSNLGITMNIYVKSVAESQVDAMDLLEKEFGEVGSSQSQPHERVQIN